MLFKKLSANYYQMTDSKGNTRRISKSRYLKETASKKVSRKNKKTYSRQVLQQLGGVGNINFKEVRNSEPSPAEMSYRLFEPWAKKVGFLKIVWGVYPYMQQTH